MKKKIISSISMLSNKELDLIHKHMSVNTELKFNDAFKVWYDENEDLCIRYSDDVFYHYNVEKGEWW